jgi:hypothetical protein
VITSHGLLESMDRVGAAGDNAAMESFFSTLQKNVLNKQHWSSRDQLRREIVYWIERTYHRRRRQRRLGKLTPVEYGTVHTAAAETVEQVGTLLAALAGIIGTGLAILYRTEDRPGAVEDETDEDAGTDHDTLKQDALR